LPVAVGRIPRYRFPVAAEREDRPGDEPGPTEEQESTERGPERPQNKPSAPSIGPRTVIERPPPEERLAKHEQSPVDAMGLDKRRHVRGGSYGPSTAKQVGLYGGFLVITVVVVLGFLTVVDRLDEPAEVHRNEAPWAQPAAPQVEPRPLDTPRNGSPDAGP
jgi:hypothetical protein